MATLSYTIGEDLGVLRDLYKEVDNYEAAFVIDLAEDIVDGFSKRHDPANVYLDKVLTVLTQNSEKDDATEAEKEAYAEVIKVIEEYKAKISG